MLIGIDANEANLTSRRVGVNQYAFDLLTALSRLKTKHKFLIFLKNPPLSDMPESRPGWEYRIIPFPRLWTQTRLPADLYFHRPRPDIFFSPSHYAPRFSPVPTVVAIMDLGFLVSPDQFTSRDFNQLKNWTAYSVRQAAKIIAISEFTRRDVINTYGKSPSDVVVTYPGYDRKLFRPTPGGRVLSRYGISRPYFLFLSSLKPSKNVEGLIRAFSGLPDKYRLVIAGKKAWMFERIFDLVRQLRLEERIIFTGFVAEAEAPALMSEAEAFVLPSLWEGFGIPALEAMACGTPVVVSRVASLPEVVGDAGILVDPADPKSIADGMIKAAGRERAKWIEKGLRQAERFNWDHTAGQTLAVIESAKK